MGCIQASMFPDSCGADAEGGSVRMKVNKPLKKSCESLDSTNAVGAGLHHLYNNTTGQPTQLSYYEFKCLLFGRMLFSLQTLRKNVLNEE